jgi:hypothetical protein
VKNFSSTTRSIPCRLGENTDETTMIVLIRWSNICVEMGFPGLLALPASKVIDARPYTYL